MINLDQFEFLDSIGSGQFGEVFRAKEKSTGLIYAAKISYIDFESDTKSKGAIKDLKREINIISKSNHPAIVKFIGFNSKVVDDNIKSVLMLEYMSKGTLNDLIKAERNGLSCPKWNETRKLITLYGIASAMSFLHSHNVIHRDLKPDNILMDDELYPKISDFGLSKIYHLNEDSMASNSNAGFKGTMIYSPPEVFLDSNYSFAGDVYSYGMILYEIMSNEKPFDKCTFMDLFKMLSNGKRPPLNSTIPDAYRELIEKCWSQKPSERPTFDQITDELRNNRDFITELVEEDQYLCYIDYINESMVSFDTGKPLVTFDKFYKTQKLKKEEIQGQIECDEDAETLFFKWKMYFYGIGRKIDKEEAFKFCKRAADKGHAEAMFQASMMLKNGDGIPTDEGDAIKYCRMAADEGNVDAMFCYFMMTHGRPMGWGKNPPQGKIFWGNVTTF